MTSSKAQTSEAAPFPAGRRVDVHRRVLVAQLRRLHHRAAGGCAPAARDAALRAARLVRELRAIADTTGTPAADTGHIPDRPRDARRE